MITAPQLSRCDSSQSTFNPVRFRSLVWAELHRTRHTRSFVVLVAVSVSIALTALIVRTILGMKSGPPIGSEAATSNTEIIGFAVFLAAAVAVARDHQTGAVDLLRSLTPVRPRHFAARVVSTGILAVGANTFFVLAGLTALLFVNPDAITWQLPDTVLRTTLASFLLAAAGVGIGALARSTATATFAVIALYWLLPIGLMIAGLTGANWAASFSKVTLGFLATNSTTGGFEHWISAGGIALWTLALVALGLFRDTAKN